ncbi:MAG: DUF2779 domain-containing protein, partial [Bdellovibrionales bacterium]|nr:DUF2779 domain-containing protein [Bdellovibrionales bacterium]
DERIFVGIGSKCKDCEFYTTKEDENNGLKSGFKECWKEELSWCDDDFCEPTVLDIWNYRKKDDLIASDKVKLKDVSMDDIITKEENSPYLTSKQRQWLQIEKIQNQDKTPFFDKAGMKSEYDSWQYPLHFIDFETSQVAIPFNKGRRPYEGIAFQFSHHIVHKDGRIEHVGDYIDTKQGHFPNYDFVRALRKELMGCNGTIFRYAAHENSYLNMIYEQICFDPNPIQDKDVLCDFIKAISKSKKESEEKWEGHRNMVDMFELVKRYYYDPAMGGSNSIKVVLPAILNSSKYLQEKYSKPIYGSDEGIPSRNFKDWTWIKKEGSTIVDPYKLLPPMFENLPDEKLDLLTHGSDLNSGGAAMSAYARIQFSEISDYEKDQLTQALLKYCELDTLAMVMIFEGWREML